LDKKQLAIKKAEAKKAVSKSGNTLFSRLRRLRLKIAQEEDIPAYLVFNDATLKEMERERPMSIIEMGSISGVGQHKLDMYGGEFLSEILLFMKDKPKRKKKGDTYKITHELFKQGLSIDEIALKRELSPTTIFSHVAKLYENGEDIDLTKFISKEDVEKVRIAKEKLENPPALRPYFDFFEEKMEYFKIRLALTIIASED